VDIQVMLPTPTKFASPMVGMQRESISLVGARIAILNNGWASMEILAPLLARRLTELGASEAAIYPTVTKEATAPERLDEVARRFSAAVVGLGN
jgi:hypothetical protein